MNEEVSLIREDIEWVSINIQEDAQNLTSPRVLLVGDSIVVGHCPLLRKKLEGRLALDFFATSKIVCDKDYWEELHVVLVKRKYDMIIFNNGLHGLKVEDHVYAVGLERVLIKLKSFAVHIAWRNNTPCFYTEAKPENPWVMRSPKRNTIALEIANKLHIPVIDAFSVLSDKKQYCADGVHYNNEGYAYLVDNEAEYIKNAINGVLL